MSHHALLLPWSRPPSSLTCLSAEASRWTTMLSSWPFSLYSTFSPVGSYHTSCHTLLTSHLIGIKGLQQPYMAPSSHFLPQVCHISSSASLLFSGSTPARFCPQPPPPIPRCFRTHQACLCLWAFVPAVPLSWKACSLSFLPSPFLYQLLVFSQKTSSQWGFLCPLYLTLQGSVTSYSSFLLNFPPWHF